MLLVVVVVVFVLLMVVVVVVVVVMQCNMGVYTRNLVTVELLKNVRIHKHCKEGTYFSQVWQTNFL